METPLKRLGEQPTLGKDCFNSWSYAGNGKPLEKTAVTYSSITNPCFKEGVNGNPYGRTIVTYDSIVKCKFLFEIRSV